MAPKPKRRYLWLGINLAGIAVYLWLSSQLWVQSGEEGTPGGPGDGFYWLFCIAPVIAAFLVFNFLALVRIVFKRSYSFKPWALLLWALVVGLWSGAVSYSHHRTIRYIDQQYTQRLTPRSTGPSCAWPVNFFR